MKYIDAKRRIMFISNMYKYIKLVMNNNKTLTMDEVVMFVRQSIPIYFNGEISIKDTKTIIKTIKSYLLRGEGQSYFTGSLEIDTKRMVYLDSIINTYFDNNIDLENVIPNKFKVKSLTQFPSISNMSVQKSVHNIKSNQQIIVKDFINFETYISQYLTINTGFQFLNVSEFNSVASNSFKSITNINLNNTFNIKQIQSELLNIESKFGFTDWFMPASKTFEYFDIDSKINLNEYFKLTTDISNHFNIRENIKFETKGAIDNHLSSKQISSDTPFKFLSIVEFKVAYPVLYSITSKMFVKNHIKLLDLATFWLNINTITKFSSKMLIDIEDIITVPLKSEDILIFSGSLNFDFLGASEFGSKNQIEINDIPIVFVDESRNIKYNKLIDLKDYMTLGLYKYALLYEIENIDMNAYRNSLIDSIIYLET